LVAAYAGPANSARSGRNAPPPCPARSSAPTLPPRRTLLPFAAEVPVVNALGERRNTARFQSNAGGRDMALQRMDNVLIVVDDLEAVKAFFLELGMELEAEMPLEGSWVDRTIGLENVRCEIAVMRTPDGHGRIEL